MGQSESISVSPTVNIVTKYTKHISGNNTKNKIFLNERSTGLSARKQILKLINEQNEEIDLNVALIVCNSYYGTSWDLGDSAINDGLLAYEQFNKFHYKTYILYDSSSQIFKETFKKYLSTFCKHLVLFYIGHGTQVKDLNGDENDNLDECLLFRDSIIRDDDLHELISKYNTSEKLTLISDCCHSETIYDVNINGGKCNDFSNSTVYNTNINSTHINNANIDSTHINNANIDSTHINNTNIDSTHINNTNINNTSTKNNIITISACMDSQTAKQDWFEHKGNGVFSYYFWKYLTENNNVNNSNPEQLRNKINEKLKVYSQTCTFNTLPVSIL